MHTCHTIIEKENVVFSSTKLRQIVGVDRAGSFSGASKLLHVSQSTLTKAVAEVEKDLGYTLFFRTARGVVATPEGREFLDRATRIVADFDMLIEDAKLQREDGDRRLRVGISPAAIEGLFNRSASTLLRQRPELSLSMVGMPLERGLRLLKRGDIDVLCGPMVALQRDKEIAVEHIHSLSMELFCRKGHPILELESFSLEQMRPYKLVTSDLFKMFGKQFDEFFRYKDGNAMNQMHVINNFSIVMQTVAETDSVSVVSTNYAKSKTFMKRFELIETGMLKPMDFGMARLSRWLPSRAVKSFREVVKRQLNSDVPPTS